MLTQISLQYHVVDEADLQRCWRRRRRRHLVLNRAPDAAGCASPGPERRPTHSEENEFSELCRALSGVHPGHMDEHRLYAVDPKRPGRSADCWLPTLKESGLGAAATLTRGRFITFV